MSASKHVCFLGVGESPSFVAPKHRKHQDHNRLIETRCRFSFEETQRLREYQIRRLRDTQNSLIKVNAEIAGREKQMRMERELTAELRREALGESHRLANKANELREEQQAEKQRRHACQRLIDDERYSAALRTVRLHRRHGHGVPCSSRRPSEAEGVQTSRSEESISVHQPTAGAIIGRRGDTIRRLRSEYTVTVNLPDSPTPERILLVAGEQEQVLNCVKECLAILRDSKENQSAKDRSRDRRGRSRSREREPPEGDLRIVVHTAVAGAFIGRGGEEVKKTRAEVRCKVQVNGDCCPNSTERIIQLAGAIDDCIEGAKRVLAVCQATVIKGPIRPYDPGFYDPTNISEYGGYPPDGAGPGPRGPPGGRGGGRFGGPPPFRGGGSGGGFGDRGPPAFGDRGGFRDDRGPPAAGRFGGGGGALPFGGGGGGGGGRGFSDARAGDFGAPPGGRGFSDNSRSDFRAAPMRGGGGGASMLMGPGGDTGGMAPPFGGGGGMGGGGGGGAPPAFVPQGGGGGISTQQVTIPDELAGTVIGKGGSEINRVREQSHARIEVDRTQARGRDRIITISGTPSQIQMAQYLLQQCVRSSQAGRAYIESRR